MTTNLNKFSVCINPTFKENKIITAIVLAVATANWDKSDLDKVERDTTEICRSEKNYKFYTERILGKVNVYHQRMGITAAVITDNEEWQAPDATEQIKKKSKS